MDEKMIEITFGIIGFAGDAKALAFEAIDEAKKGNIDVARKKLEESKSVMFNAHKFQTELIQKEASGEKTDMSVMLVHSQDHLMTSMTFQQLAGEFVDLYERLNEK